MKSVKLKKIKFFYLILKNTEINTQIHTHQVKNQMIFWGEISAIHSTKLLSLIYKEPLEITKK